jgi:ADP-ribose pyrophosphatase
MERWRKLEEHVAYAGRRRVLGRRFQLPDGDELDFEVKDEQEIVTVVAMTSERQVVLVRQFRVGPEKILLELPGGALEPGEDPLEGARRELREETGYSGDVRPVGTTFHCAYSTRSINAFVATDCRRVGEPAPHEGEVIEVVLVGLEAFREHLRSGRLTDVAAGYLGLDALGLL